MSYTKTPVQSTDQTKTVPLLYNWDSRNDGTDTYDTLLKNALLEPVGQDKFHMLKRDGFEKVALTPAPNFPIIGIYLWNKLNSPNPILVVVTSDGTTGNAFVQLYNANTLVQTSSVALANVNRADYDIEFTEYLFQSGVTNVFFTVKGQLVRIDDVLATTIVATAATAAIFSPVFLDGYLFVSDGTNIWNSNLNDPVTWSASNFLAVDSYPDAVRALARVGTYIVAFGTDSAQWFYDAANPTGTPLAANVGATRRVGYYGGLAKFGDDVLFIGNSSSSVPTLYRVTGLKLAPVASFQYARMWIKQASTFATSVTSAPLGAIINLNGHNCYFVRTPSTIFPVPGPVPSNLSAQTYIYDLDSEAWSKIGYQANDFFLIKTSTLPYSFTAGVPIATWVSVLGDGFVYRPNPTVYQDNGVNFEVRFRTPLMDFGTRRAKFGARILVTGDETSSSSLVNISWTNDDYKTFSTPRPVDMSFRFQPLYALGSFRARSFVMTYSDNFPMRWQSLELDYDQGSA